MKLYRSVGHKELKLITDSGYCAFPSRLPEQPFFYPVLNFEYADQMAKEWNVKDAASDYAGFVTAFEIDDDFMSKYEIHQVGTQQHKEYWIPAEDLEEFNHHIKGQIEILATYFA